MLGHHYQRDEVIRVRRRHRRLVQAGARRGGPPGRGVHRLLRRALHGRVGRHPHRAAPEGDPARPRGRLLDGRHGPDRPGRGRLGRAGRRRRRRRHRSRHLHELLRRHQGVLRHATAAPSARRATPTSRSSGPSSRRPTPRCSSSPTSTSAATPPCSRWASPLDDCVVWDPQPPGGGLTAERAARAQDDPVEGPLLGARPLLRRRRRRRPRDASRASRSWCTPSASTRSCSRPTWSARRSSSSRPSRPPRPARAWAIGTELNLVQRLAKPPRQEHRLPRPERLLLRDDEPDRPAALRLGAGEPRRRHVVNRIEVDPETEHYAKVALDRMLALPGKTHRD